MSATLLLLSKNEKSTRQLKSMRERLKSFLAPTLQRYFGEITYQVLNDALLAEFRQKNSQKDIDFYSDNKGNWLAIEGFVCALDKTRRFTASELFDSYRRSGDGFADRLDGHFVVKLHDTLQARYLIVTDIIKSKTNYLCENDDYILITPFAVTAGLVVQPELDIEAFNEFMWRYYVLSEKSLLRNVTRLSAATLYSVSGGRLTRRTYWQWPSSFSTRSFPDSVDDMVDRMQESARLIHDSFEKPCCDFTMGQDSRQVVSSFTSQKLPIATATFGKDEFHEVRQVKKMAEHHGIENHNIQLSGDFLPKISDYFKKAILLGSGEEPGYLLGRILFMREQHLDFGRVSLTGMDGHFYKNGLWDEMYTLNLYREPRRFNVDMFLKLRALSKNYREDIFTPLLIDVKNRSKEYFRTIVHTCITSHLSSPVSIQVDKFDLNHWLNFGIVSISSVNAVLPLVCPLLLRRNLELALQIPVQWKFNLSKFQRAVVFRMDPALAREKTDVGVTMVPKNVLTFPPFYFHYFYHQSARMRNKIKSIVSLPVLTHLQEAWDYKPLYDKLFRTFSTRESIGLDVLIQTGIVDRNKWTAYVDEFTGRPDLREEEYEYFLKIVGIDYFLRTAEKLTPG